MTARIPGERAITSDAPEGVPCTHGSGEPSPVVLQLAVPRAATVRVEDLPWSEGYAYQATVDQPLALTVNLYNFGPRPARGRLQIVRQPAGWDVAFAPTDFAVDSQSRTSLAGRLRVAVDSRTRDGWVVLRAGGALEATAVLAFRVVARP